MKNTSKTLKVLSVLTIISCCIDYWSDIKKLIYGDDKSIQDIRDAQSSGLTFIKKIYTEDLLNFTIASNNNIVSISIIGIISTTLCLIGALKMRNQIKDGFIFYLCGQLLPLIGTIIFTGLVIFKTFFIYFLIFPLLFVFLYYNQLKKMN
jgi:hypothetical protein